MAVRETVIEGKRYWLYAREYTKKSAASKAKEFKKAHPSFRYRVVRTTESIKRYLGHDRWGKSNQIFYDVWVRGKN